MGKGEPFYVDIKSLHEEVTGSCNLVTVNFPNGEKVQFVVDCGLFQEKKYNTQNQSLGFDAEAIDFCAVTHVHADHIGRLPFLVKEGFSGNIYATNATCKLIPLALADSLKILTSNAKRKHIDPIYKSENLTRTLELLRSCKYNKTKNVHKYVNVTFLPNAHLVGAALVLVQISFPDYQDINLLFTGDYNSKNTFIVERDIPKWVLELPLTVVQESTYGDTESSDVVKCFRKNVLSHLEHGGTVVAPVFSLGRSQEILYELKLMQDDGKLDTQIPIYFDGALAHKYTNLYKTNALGLNEKSFDFLPENLTYVGKNNRMGVLKSREAKIIVTTSGMGSYGPAMLYIPEYLSRKDALIHFTGFTPEGTLGHRLQSAQDGQTVQIGDSFITKKAQIKYTSEYSSHAKADEIIDFLKQFENLKLVLVNHGELSVKRHFAKRVEKEVAPKAVDILGDGYTFRVCPYGLVRAISESN